MRIYLGGIATETDSFSPMLADKDTFKRGYWYIGNELEAFKNTTMDGEGAYRYLLSQDDVEIVPGFAAYSVTAGPVKQNDFEEMTELLFESLRNAGSVDGVVMLLHGAMQSEQCMDTEGFILEKTKEIVGRDVPVAATYDLHACISPKMAQNMEAVSCYHTYPHTDHNTSGYRAAEALVRVIREGVKPQLIYKRLPMIMPVENCNTAKGPAAEAMSRLEAFIADKNVMSGAMCLTQPWLDVPDLGCQVCAYIEPNADIAEYEKKATGLLEFLWDSRGEFEVEVPSFKEALKQSEACDKPCSIVELGDIVSAGGIGDSTEALCALLEEGYSEPVCMVLTDAATVAKAVELGIGKTAEFELGGSESGYNRRVSLLAEVVNISGEPYRNLGDCQKGVLTFGGKRALLKSGNINIAVSEYSYISHDKNSFLSLGLNPKEMSIIVQKTHQMFKSGYIGVSKAFIYADTPGYTDRNLKRLPYKNVSRPVYPLDD